MNMSIRQVTGLLVAFALLLPAPALAGKIFAWKAEKGGRSVVLLGSIHLANDSLYPLDSGLVAAFDEADMLAVEADPLAVAGSLEGQMAMMGGMMYPPGETLSKNLSADTYAMAKAFLTKRGLDISLFEVTKPWALSMALTSTEMTRLGFSAEKGIDMFFLRRAREKGTEIRELEGMQFQLDILNGWSDERQESFLRSSLEDMDRLEGIIDTLMGAWKRGEIGTFEELAIEPMKTSSDYNFIYQSMLVDRNVTMADKIEGYIDEGKKAFVVVGGGHMVGSDGIVAILQNRGYTVRQMDSTR